ncbi:MAG TPA: cob(I)yrinic acid a,c-diamide adenosyltransferase [bacterium]|nr:cob(I)yrinic acid a,c-diamide adenosyltransferase [bacterium]
MQVYTGDGKGKTTAALGLLLRFVGSGGKACFIQFDKGAAEGSDFYNERKVFPLLPSLTHVATGLPRFNPENNTFRFKNIPADFSEAQRGLELAHHALGQGYGLVVLDEILSAVLTGLLQAEEVLKLLDNYEQLGRPCELLFTGHQIWPELEARVDLITVMTKRKHYFDQSVKARKGIEF